jgi:hypothetical protein
MATHDAAGTQPAGRPASGDHPSEDDAPGHRASDDYGYDMAHEAQAALRIPVARRHRPDAPMGRGRAVDQDGDLGYDAAHETPARETPSSDRPHRT